MTNDRLDQYLNFKINYYTRSQIQYLIFNSRVLLNNIIEKRYDKRIIIGDNILISTISKLSNIIPYNIKINIVYEDKDLILINKPSNLTMHKGINTNNKTLSEALIFHSKNLSSLNDVT